MIDFNFYKTLLTSYFKEMTDYRQIEGFIFVSIFSTIFATMIKTNQFSFWYILLGLFAFFTIIIEHKTILYFDKKGNIITITEKALFLKKYKIINKINYDLLEYVSLNQYNGPSAHTVQNKTRTYTLEFRLKNKTTIKPIKYASNNEKFWKKHSDTINNFLNSNVQALTITFSPYTFRIIGILLTILCFIPFFEYVFLPSILKFCN